MVAGGALSLNVALQPQASSDGGIPDFPIEAILMGLISATFFLVYKKAGTYISRLKRDFSFFEF